MRRRVRPHLLILIAAMLTAGVIAKAPPEPEQAEFARLSGAELVQRLADEKNRGRAFFELWRRASDDKDTDFDSFEESHYDPELVICPQGEGRGPIYLVLCGFISRTPFQFGDAYPIEKPDELFPRTAKVPRATKLNDPLIEAFDANGKLITPFGGDNVLQGTLFDVNGDGLIERVEATNYGVDDIKQVSALNISTVRARTQPLFSLLLNWGADEWTYRVEDGNGDGFAEIQAGPRAANGMKVKATWKWDKSQGTFVGPTGAPGDHFRVLKPGEIWKQL